MKIRELLGLNDIPPEILGLRRWVAYKLVPRGKGKPSKVPVDPKTGRNAKADDPSTWGALDQALACAAKDGVEGIGIELGGNLWGVDFDSVRDPRNGRIDPEIYPLMYALGSYTEVSPSGKGLHVLGFGGLPAGHVSKIGNHVEVYTEGRFFTFTGKHLKNTPRGVLERREALETFYAAVMERFFVPYARSGSAEIPEEIPEGMRNDALCSLAALFRWRDATAEEVLEQLREVNLKRCRPPGVDARIREIARWASKLPTGSEVTATLFKKLQDAAGPAEKGKLLTEMYELLSRLGKAQREVWIQELKKAKISNVGATREGMKGAWAKGRADGDEERKQLTTVEYIALYEEWEYRMRLNECNDDVELNGEYFRDVMGDLIDTKVWDYGIEHEVGVNIAHARAACTVMALRDQYHPVQEYLEKLPKWGGEDHAGDLIAHLTEKTTDHSDHDDQKAPRVLDRWVRLWLTGCVATVYEEDYQNPMLVLIGLQDIGKSWLHKWLFGGLPKHWFSGPIRPDVKDCRLRLTGVWGWEVGELERTTRGSVEALKEFLTLSRVRARKSYGRRDIDKPTISTFCGTTNSTVGFLRDYTGNRRYLVVSLAKIDWKYTKDVDRDQLWAQCLATYRKDDSWRMTDADKAKRDESNLDYMVVNTTNEFLVTMYEITGDRGDVERLTSILDDLNTHGIKATGHEVGTILGSWDGVTAARLGRGQGRAIVYQGLKAKFQRMGGVRND